MPKRDPLGYYTALHVSPHATSAEIRLSYTFIKRSYQRKRRDLDVAKIRAAYETLSDPLTREMYDNGEIARVGAPSRLGSIPLRPVLLPLLIVAVLVLVGMVGPGFLAQLRDFEPGDEIYWSTNDETLGKVLSFEREHQFPSGSVSPAFEILPASGEAPVWYPARDLKRYARTR